MKLVTAIDTETLDNATLIAESNEYAIYDVGNDTFALVHRHAAVEWQANYYSAAMVRGTTRRGGVHELGAVFEITP